MRKLKAKKRNPDSLSSSVGNTYRFYLPNNLYDMLMREATNKDIAISRLLRSKLEELEEIKQILQKNKFEVKG